MALVRFLDRRVLRRVSVAATLAAAAGCSQPYTSRAIVVPAPANAIAAIALGDDEIAVLAGDEDARSVALVDRTTGAMRRRFGVTADAKDLSLASARGPLLVAIGTGSGRRSVGALERWSLSGRKLGVTPLPAAGLALTATVGDRVYALVGGSADRAAVALEASTGRVLATIPLPAETAELAACSTAAGDELVGRAPMSPDVSIVDGRTKRTRLSPVDGRGPVCDPTGRTIAFLRTDAGTQSIVRFSFPSMNSIGELPAAGDATRLSLGPDGGMYVLAGTADASDVAFVSSRKLERDTVAVVPR